MNVRPEYQIANTISPRVSLIIPAFNVSPAVMAESLRSIQQQTFGDFESIIVDESTNSECAAACKAFCAGDSRFIYMRPASRLGLAGSLNYGLERARGEFIARFDSDDICVPERLARQVDYLDLNPNIGVLGGWLEIISEQGRSVALRRYPETYQSIAAAMQITTAVAHPTIMFRKVIAENFGAYSPDFRFAEDLDLWLRWMNSGVVFHNLPVVLVKYRQSLTRRTAAHWKFTMRARLRNFSGEHVLRRCVGILVASAYPLVPDLIQERLYRHVIFSKNRNEAGVR